MNLIVCVDDRMGMMFHNRRQSKDRVVREDMLSLVSGQLWVSAYTAGQFTEQEQERLHCSEDFLAYAEEHTYCFVEDVDIMPYADKIEQIILYRWNRTYPADTYFTLNLTAFTLVERRNLTGNSHPDIVREIYVKKAVRKEEADEKF